jgi:outer membrane protein assembly factor BamB
MKKKHLLTLMPLLAMSLFLTACGEAVAAGSWPGIIYDETRSLVYVANNQFVHAIQIENGLERWQFPAEPQGGFASYAAPELTTDGQLIVGGYDNILYSLNAENGAQNWTFPGAVNRYIGSSLAVGDQIFAPNADHQLYILGSQGNLVKTFAAQDPLWGRPAGDGTIVYLTSMDHFLYALDAQSGEELWKLDLEATIVGSPGLGADGMIYVGTLDHTLFAVDPQSHREVWRFATQGWIWATPLIVDGQLFVGDLDGIFYGVDAASGEEQWRVDTGGAITGTPALFNDSLYIGNEAGRIFSISLDGRSRELTLPETYQGLYYGSPVLAGDLLLLGITNNENIVIALDSDDSVVWSFVP